MAKVLDPFGSREVRGSVGGLTYSRGPGGQYVKSKGRVLNKATADQMSLRVAFQECVAYYQTLERWEMELWEEYARVWREHFAVGSRMGFCAITRFKQSNVLRRIVRYPWIRVPPKSPVCSYKGKFEMYYTPSAVMGRLNPGPKGQQVAWYSASMRPQSFARFQNEKWRRIFVGGKEGPGPHTFWEFQQQGKFNARYFGRARVCDDEGNLGPWLHTYLDLLD